MNSRQALIVTAKWLYVILGTIFVTLAVVMTIGLGVLVVLKSVTWLGNALGG